VHLPVRVLCRSILSESTGCSHGSKSLLLAVVDDRSNACCLMMVLVGLDR
jgi:hypothetical protein